MKYLLTILLLITFAAHAQQVNDSTFIDLKLPLTVGQDYSLKPLFDRNGNAYKAVNPGLNIQATKLDSGYFVFIPTNSGLFNVKALFQFTTDFIVKDLPYGSETPWGTIKKGQYKTKISQHSTFRKALDSGYKLGGTKNIQKGYFEVWEYDDGRIEIKQPLISIE